MSPNREDYIKCILYAGGDAAFVSNKYIAERLGVSGASATEMTTKLVAEGALEKRPYKGVRLTAEGIERARALSRIHRLWEVFLVEHLGYRWDEVHEDAERLEHAASDRLVQRLDAFLGHPQHCPHGGLIPGGTDRSR